jgi:hypothetical protein
VSKPNKCMGWHKPEECEACTHLCRSAEDEENLGIAMLDVGRDGRCPLFRKAPDRGFPDVR